MKTIRINGLNNVNNANRNWSGIFKQVAKLISLLLLANLTVGCVSIDRALNPISNHTIHHAFNHQDIATGGILIAAVVDRYDEINIEESLEITERAKEQFKSERKEFDVSSARPFFGQLSQPNAENKPIVVTLGDSFSANVNLPQVENISETYYREMLEMYQRERWISPELLAKVRDSVPQRFLLMARIEDTSQGKSSSCSVRYEYTEQKKREEKSGEEEDYDEIKYQLTRSASRYAEISVDVFDLAQDIIVWSATNDSGASHSNSYKTHYNINDHESRDEFPYPGYPSWYSAYYNTFYAFAVHLPHASD